MSQIRGFIRDGLAYMLASTKLGQNITGLSEEMERLRKTELAIRSVTKSPSCCGKATLFESCTTDILRQALDGLNDPRYIKNPFYNPKKYNRSNGHYLFDQIKKPDEISNNPNWAYLRKGTVITASGIDFELKENTKVIGRQNDADKVMADQSERYQS